MGDEGVDEAVMKLTKRLMRPDESALGSRPQQRRASAFKSRVWTLSALARDHVRLRSRSYARSSLI